jgi:hypothetical protein
MSISWHCHDLIRRYVTRTWCRSSSNKPRAARCSLDLRRGGLRRRGAQDVSDVSGDAVLGYEFSVPTWVQYHTVDLRRLQNLQKKTDPFQIFSTNQSRAVEALDLQPAGILAGCAGAFVYMVCLCLILIDTGCMIMLVFPGYPAMNLSKLDQHFPLNEAMWGSSLLESQSKYCLRTKVSVNQQDTLHTNLTAGVRPKLPS